jgi:hypothetical protein
MRELNGIPFSVGTAVKERAQHALYSTLNVKLL